MADRARVFVTRALPGDGVERLRGVADVEVWPDIDPPPEEALRERTAGAAGLLSLLTDRVDEAFLEACPRLRIVANMAVGYDNIDVAAATRRGVAVTNTPGILVEATADQAFALLIGFSRRIVEGDRAVRDGTWPLWRPDYMLGRELNGATLGIIGLGAIGLAVARRAMGFGMRVIYTSRNHKPDAEATGIEWREQNDLLREADFVSIHAALTPETRHIVGARELRLMKRDAVLVNTARGGLVDQQALVEALKEGVIGGAALDVFETEPLPPNDPLLKLDNVLVAPHLGSATLATRIRMADLAFENLIAFFTGNPLPTCVNREVLNITS